MSSLLECVADLDNLARAFRLCARGKRGSMGYQRAMFAQGEKLISMHRHILSGEYPWQRYREILVKDPKSRRVHAAPFLDRVVHHAIHSVIEPILDPLMPTSVYACRHGKGNRQAALDLLEILRGYGQQRFVIKLDVAKYFASIDHHILLDKLLQALPDQSLAPLLSSLLRSHSEYAARACGIPIGNLTSQAFANFYLVSVDHLAAEELGDGFYLRYMDDMILGGCDKARVLDAAEAVIEHAQNVLKLAIPYHKRMPLGDAPVPFLGYVLDHSGYRLLSRNQRRFAKHMRRLEHAGARPSRKAQSELSFHAFANLI